MDRGEDADEALMLRYRAGDAAAFERLYARHRAPLFRFLLRQVGDRAVAEELHQEVWIALVRGRRRYRISARFTTFLYRIARSRVIDQHRAATRRGRGLGRHAETEPDTLQAAQPGVDARVDGERAVIRLRVLVEALPAEQREVFLLHQEAALDLDAIARVTGVGRETVKSRLRYAIAKLRAGLGLET